MENTSNESFLRQGFHEDETPESLLKAPTYLDETELREQSTDSFKNLPPLDFSIPSQRALITAELENFKTKNICPVIDGKDIQTTHIVKNLSPENPENVISNAHYANTEHAEKSIKSLSKGFQHWSNESLRNRAQILIKVAALMTKRRAYFTALLIREASKQWVDADAEVCEAIDFLNYYALQAESLSEGSKLSDTPGENNTLKYVPRGLSLVIGPWNFPLAIPCGMMSANLVCGNPTILKPAEQTSRIASEMFNLFLECGLPADCSAFLPGKGEEIGQYLSEHPNISTITFTGSRAVGTMLIKSAGDLFSKSKNGKKVVAEMGGKNAIIVDETADPDEAVKGIIKSAFGFQGQKCSACSRLLVQESIYESFLSRLAEAIKSIKVGPATEPYNKVGAVIDTEARDRISGYIERAQAELKIVAQSEGPGGSYISPVAFRDVPTEHPLMQEEVFGPVLAICAFDTIKTAVNIANSTDYSLTGGIYSRSPANIQYCIDHVDVGNFYINRNCTGAMVERHPFGGFNPIRNWIQDWRPELPATIYESKGYFRKHYEKRVRSR